MIPASGTTRNLQETPLFTVNSHRFQCYSCWNLQEKFSEHGSSVPVGKISYRKTHNSAIFPMPEMKRKLSGSQKKLHRSCPEKAQIHIVSWQREYGFPFIICWFTGSHCAIELKPSHILRIPFNDNGFLSVFLQKSPPPFLLFLGLPKLRSSKIFKDLNFTPPPQRSLRISILQHHHHKLRSSKIFKDLNFTPPPPQIEIFEDLWGSQFYSTATANWNLWRSLTISILHHHHHHKLRSSKIFKDLNFPSPPQIEIFEDRYGSQFSGIRNWDPRRLLCNTTIFGYSESTQE